MSLFETVPALRRSLLKMGFGASATVLATAVLVAPAAAAETDMSSSGVSASGGYITGNIAAGEWKKVVSGWGKYNAKYYGSLASGGGEYKCYVDGVRISSGALPSEFTLVVAGYGSCFFYSPVTTTYVITGVS
ncbi:hypothetical protein ACH4ZX_12895 [Streptomyces sp. NPDC020490]|uniref:hypothetical protein n=1 Tax=Streptomyces sp. NPDC020490 TaxID=3365078 RepID=UPI00379AA161